MGTQEEQETENEGSFEQGAGAELNKPEEFSGNYAKIVTGQGCLIYVHIETFLHQFKIKLRMLWQGHNSDDDSR